MGFVIRLAVAGAIGFWALYELSQYAEKTAEKDRSDNDWDMDLDNGE